MAGEVLIFDYYGAALTVVCQSADEGEPIPIGDTSRAWAGNDRSSIRAEKRTWSVLTTKIPTEIKLAIMQIIARRAQFYVGSELPQANPVLDPFDFSTTRWTRTNMTVSAPGISDPFNGTGARTLTATAVNADLRQALASSVSLSRQGNLWLKRRTGSGTISLINPDAVGLTNAVVTANWQRFPTTAITSVTRYVGMQIAVSGDAVDAYNSVLTSDPILCTATAKAKMQEGTYLWEMNISLVEV